MRAYYTTDTEHVIPAAVGPVLVVVRKSGGGFGGAYNPDTTKPYGVFVSGSLLKTKSGTVRVFGSRAAAVKAAELAVNA